MPNDPQSDLDNDLPTGCAYLLLFAVFVLTALAGVLLYPYSVFYIFAHWQ